MKSKLLPGNRKHYEAALQDLPKAMKGQASSYLRVTLPLPASKKEGVFSKSCGRFSCRKSDLELI
jgi:hypothetical protein